MRTSFLIACTLLLCAACSLDAAGARLPARVRERSTAHISPRTHRDTDHDDQNSAVALTDSSVHGMRFASTAARARAEALAATEANMQQQLLAQAHARVQTEVAAGTTTQAQIIANLRAEARAAALAQAKAQKLPWHHHQEDASSADPDPIIVTLHISAPTCTYVRDARGTIHTVATFTASGNIRVPLWKSISVLMLQVYLNGVPGEVAAIDEDTMHYGSLLPDPQVVKGMVEDYRLSGFEFTRSYNLLKHKIEPGKPESSSTKERMIEVCVSRDGDRKYDTEVQCRHRKIILDANTCKSWQLQESSVITNDTAPATTAKSDEESLEEKLAALLGPDPATAPAQNATNATQAGAPAPNNQTKPTNQTQTQGKRPPQAPARQQAPAQATAAQRQAQGRLTQAPAAPKK